MSLASENQGAGEGHGNFQRKIDPHASLGNGLGDEAESDTWALLQAAARIEGGSYASSSTAMEEIEGLRAQLRKRAASRQARQPLVVVASLIDKVPNLAGLARTCEVFQASSLVVADRRVAQDPSFAAISVTAEKWLPISECPESALVPFLIRKKRQGYTIIGVEQTAESVPLHSFDFVEHERAVILLGREKEGIPSELLALMDFCVEIPQLGLIRSLNVHVSAALAIYEFTRQRLLAAAQADFV